MIYNPPDKWYNATEATIPLIYLAGTMGNIDWQHDAIHHLTQVNMPLDIANPRPLPNPELFQDLSENDAFIINMEWQVAHIRLASSFGGILFWLANDDTAKNPSLYEMGEWLQNMKWRKIAQPDREPLKLIVGIEPDNPDDKYIRHRLGQDLPDFKIYSNLQVACEEMVKLCG